MLIISCNHRKKSDNVCKWTVKIVCRCRNKALRSTVGLLKIFSGFTVRICTEPLKPRRNICMQSIFVICGLRKYLSSRIWLPPFPLLLSVMNRDITIKVLKLYRHLFLPTLEHPPHPFFLFCSLSDCAIWKFAFKFSLKINYCGWGEDTVVSLSSL